MSQAELCARIAHTLANAPIHDHLGYEALAYLKLPGPDYLTLLRFLHATLRPKLYVEIGVRTGDTLKLADPAVTKSIAIDPHPMLSATPANTLLSISTSDAYFRVEGHRERARGFDLAFIDGDHSFDQALRDFENLEKLAKPTSIICLHDVIPMDEKTATPKAETSFHTGDVWRLMAAIVAERTDLVAFTVTCPPSGLGIVGNFKGLSIPSIVESGFAYPRSWDDQVRALNIVPNDGKSIGAAFAGLR